MRAVVQKCANPGRTIRCQKKTIRLNIHLMCKTINFDAKPIRKHMCSPFQLRFCRGLMCCFRDLAQQVLVCCKCGNGQRHVLVCWNHGRRLEGQCAVYALAPKVPGRAEGALELEPWSVSQLILNRRPSFCLHRCTREWPPLGQQVNWVSS